MSWRGVGNGCVAKEGWEERSFGEGGSVGYCVEEGEDGTFHR